MGEWGEERGLMRINWNELQEISCHFYGHTSWVFEFLGIVIIFYENNDIAVFFGD
jgi:hypothetical protein